MRGGGAGAIGSNQATSISTPSSFKQSPPRPCILVKRRIASAFLGYLGLATPEVAWCACPLSFYERIRHYLQLGSPAISFDPVWHFVHACRSTRRTPATMVSISFRRASRKDENLNSSPPSLAFYRMIGTVDSAQAMFVRARLRNSCSRAERIHSVCFVAKWWTKRILLEGPHWRARIPHVTVCIPASRVPQIRGLRFQPWLVPDRARFPPGDCGSGGEADPAAPGSRR